MKRSSRAALGTSVLALMATAALGAAPAIGHGNGADKSNDRSDNRAVSLKANLTELNNSGVSGRAVAVVKGQTIQHMKVKAEGLTPDAPHAQHIHYGDDALNECPTLRQDTNKDGRINTVEGVPAYGPVVVSLTTSGSTSFTEVLAVSRYPVAREGRINYVRNDIPITSVPGTGYGPAGGTAEQIADSLREGEGVVVIHGLDYDDNGKYSFSKEGESELDPKLPAEATDPAACGVLR